MILVLAASSLTAIGLLSADWQKASRPVTEIKRNTYGQGTLITTLRVIIDGVEQEEPLEIAVEERRYTIEEMDAVFDRALEKLESLILGENESLDQVRSDLNLVTEIPGEPVEVSWELNRYDLMNVYGELNEENLRQEPEGALVTLKAYLTYREDESIEILEELAARVYPPELSGEAKELAGVKEAIEQQEENTREETSVSLPEEVEGRTVQLFEPDNPRGWYVLALGPVICGLLFCLQRQNEQKEKEDRQRQMMLDYPEIVNKLTLLLGAGMTVKNAWQKIVQDYERQKESQKGNQKGSKKEIQRESRGVRYAYEEMTAAYHEMQSGVTEVESYERFGRRCGVKAYRKLAALLTQNLRKGTRGLTELLAAESAQAFEERKAAAKRRGEEAGTKLLAPMFLMLAMVLVIVIIPAFLSIQM